MRHLLGAAVVFLVTACTESVSEPGLPSPEQRMAGCFLVGMALGAQEGDQFLAFECPDGTVVLRPVPNAPKTPAAPPQRRNERSA